jgi:hypothetical protein
MKKQAPQHFHDVMSSEIRKAFEEVLQDRREGKHRPAPRDAKSCHSLEDLCRYVFKVARLDGEYQMLMVGPTLKRWVWHGHTFTDRFVNVVQAVVPILPDRDQLEELRLVATRVTASGVERLRGIFPKSKVRVYTDEDSDENWQLSQATYSANGLDP